MNRDAKRISPNSRARVSVTKSNILNSRGYFDGVGNVFRTAVKELRAKGYAISYDRTKYMYKLEQK